MKIKYCILFLMLLALPNIGYCQPDGLDYENAIPASDNIMDYEALIKYDSSNYAIFFEKNPIGIKHAINKTNELLIENRRIFLKPYRDASYLTSYVEGITDYENLDLSISQGSSEVIKSWMVYNWEIILRLEKEYYLIFITKRPPYEKE